MLEPVSSYIRRKGFRKLVPEMQFYDFRMDIYGYSKSLDMTVAVELKLGNWHKAFEQTLIYMLCADIVYIAVPKETCRNCGGGGRKRHTFQSKRTRFCAGLGQLDPGLRPPGPFPGDGGNRRPVQRPPLGAHVHSLAPERPVAVVSHTCAAVRGSLVC